MTYRLEQTLISIILWLNPWLAQHALQSWPSCIRPVRSIRDRMCGKRGCGRTGPRTLPRGTSFDGVEPRDRWADALTRPVPDHAALTRVKSSLAHFHQASLYVCGATREIQHESTMGWSSWISPEGPYSCRIVSRAASPL